MFVLVDGFILLALIGLARSGWRRGFAAQVIDLVGFSAALLLAIRFHDAPARALRWLHVPEGWAAIGGGAVVFLPLIALVAVVGARVGRVVAQPGLRMTNKVLGVGFSLAWAAAALVGVIVLTQVAPVPAPLAGAVRRSPLARMLRGVAPPATGLIERLVERDGRDWTLFLRRVTGSAADRASPQPSEEPAIRFSPVPAAALVPAPDAERELLRLANEARAGRDLRPLVWDERLAAVGRSHSRDMYEQGFFGHRGSDGSSPARRLARARIAARASAENLALAATPALAHQGLMDSPGHRRNILDPGLGKLGIGVLQGPNGLMASQEFCGGC